MPSPFPGMDPYLEEPGLWLDAHHELMSVMRELMMRRLTEGPAAERNHVADSPDAAIARHFDPVASRRQGRSLGSAGGPEHRP